MKKKHNENNENDKNWLKCECTAGFFVNSVRELVVSSFGIKKASGYKINENPTNIPDRKKTNRDLLS